LRDFSSERVEVCQGENICLKCREELEDERSKLSKINNYLNMNSMPSTPGAGRWKSFFGEIENLGALRMAV